MADSYKDPFMILGVPRDVSDDDLKKAYRELVKKYHPDNYANTPMAELAEEKMKEINEAYDQIKQMRTAGADPNGQRKDGYDARQTFDRVRRMINEGNIDGADRLLGIFSTSDRGAEWNYLKGCVNLRRGYFYEAQKYFEIACYLDPTNAEYRAALNNCRTANDRQNYRTYGNDSQNADAASNCCEALLCTHCCCNCLGGDLFRCC